jgi:DNA-binding PadR family transcriptional regulator
MKKAAASPAPRLFPPRPRENGGRAGAASAKTSLEHALLGLVAEIPEVTGYDIVKLFALSMSHYWHAHQGQIYPTLDRMERRGLIRSREIIQRGRPNKRVFKIAPAGERMLVQWLHSPTEPLRIKHSQLVRTRFLGHLGAEQASAKLEEQRARWEGYLRAYREIEREHFRGRPYRDVNEMFAYFTLRYGIDWMEQSLRWCEWAIGELRRNRGLFTSPTLATPARSRRTGVRRSRSDA